MAAENSDTNFLELATELTIAWLTNPGTRAAKEDVPVVLKTMHDAIAGLVVPRTSTENTAAAPIDYVPAVSVRRSLASKDHIISLIDGKPYKTLKRHLSGHGLTPAQYRERYGLKADYPIVAQSYVEMRRDMAKRIGLGRKPKAAVASPEANQKTIARAKPTSTSPGTANVPAVKKPGKPCTGKTKTPAA